MKKIITVLLVSLMLLVMAACGNTQKENEPAAEWDRKGYYQSEEGYYLYVDKLEDYPEDGWYVLFLEGESMLSGFLPQSGADLKGDLYSDLETKADPKEATISVDGDGLKLVFADGKTYKCAPSDIAERTFTITINTEGYGFFNALTGSGEFETEDDFSTSSFILNLQEPATYTITAQPGEEGWIFVEWLKNGVDYSVEPEIVEEFTEDAEYVAVFEYVSE